MPYTPGYSSTSVNFMRRRSLATHGDFFVPFLTKGMQVLDCGCGPGKMTVEIARRTAPGDVVGFDMETSQTAAAAAEASAEGLGLRFEQGSVYSLPFPNASFDRVFSHALFEHLWRPAEALAELMRVLRPGGWIGLRSPDWGGFLMHPEISGPVSYYERLQRNNGGNLYAGRTLPALLRKAGFTDVRFSARYEVYPEPELIANYLAETIEASAGPNGAGPEESEARRLGGELRAWAKDPDALFAQCWGEAVGRKP